MPRSLLVAWLICSILDSVDASELTCLSFSEVERQLQINASLIVFPRYPVAPGWTRPVIRSGTPRTCKFVYPEFHRLRGESAFNSTDTLADAVFKLSAGDPVVIKVVFAFAARGPPCTAWSPWRTTRLVPMVYG